MSPRPKTVTDDEVFAAAQRAMTARGPRELTLQHIAAEAGVTAGRLVQRYGSRRGLLLALAARFAGSADDLFAALARDHRSPLAALRAYAACMAGLAPSPEAVARNLAYLHIDLTDADFRPPLVQNAAATRRHLERLVRAAVRDGELRPAARPATLARVIETIVSGSLMTWACYQEGPAAAWLSRDLEAVLAPYLAARARRRPRSATRTPRSRPGASPRA